MIEKPTYNELEKRVRELEKTANITNHDKGGGEKLKTQKDRLNNILVK